MRRERSPAATATIEVDEPQESEADHSDEDWVARVGLLTNASLLGQVHHLAGDLAERIERLSGSVGQHEGLREEVAALRTEGAEGAAALHERMTSIIAAQEALAERLETTARALEAIKTAPGHDTAVGLREEIEQRLAEIAERLALSDEEYETMRAEHDAVAGRVKDLERRRGGGVAATPEVTSLRDEVTAGMADLRTGILREVDEVVEKGWRHLLTHVKHVIYPTVAGVDTPIDDEAWLAELDRLSPANAEGSDP